jgi:HSP20 family protein
MGTSSNIQNQGKGEQAKQEKKQAEMAKPQGERTEQETRETAMTEGGARLAPRGGMARYASPFSMMRRMMDDFARVFEDPWFGGGLMRDLGGGLMREVGFEIPNVDMFQRDGELVVCVDLPGVDRDQVNLEITEDGLAIEGRRMKERKEEEQGFYRRERAIGSFRRLIPLPAEIDPETAHAELKNGVLEVAFKLPEEKARRRRVEIKGGEEEATGKIEGTTGSGETKTTRH